MADAKNPVPAGPFCHSVGTARHRGRGAPGGPPPWAWHAACFMDMTMPVGDYCRREVWTVRPDQTIREAAGLMREHRVGFLVVIDGGRPVGALSDRDIALDVLRGKLDADAVRVSELMSTPVHNVEEGEPFRDALDRMRARGVRRLVVVDARGSVSGVICADDVALLLARELQLATRPVDAQRTPPPPSLEQIQREQAIDRSE